MFDPTLAEIRFGTGLSPKIAPPQSVAAMLSGLQGADSMVRQFPVEPFDTFRHRVVAYNKAQRAYRQNRGKPDEQKYHQARKTITKGARSNYVEMVRNRFLRRIHTETGFRERVVFFWQDHFTARGKSNITRQATGPYVEDVIRPNITGKFEDLLIAAVTHPLMLHYLDQAQSAGPNSKIAKRAEQRGRIRGLNENLAREVLELHTLGVSAGYTQDDVRQLAELFTGLTIDKELLFSFNAAISEPGAETVLGKTYGKQASVENVTDALRNLARHPATARHISEKLARHFVADQPAEALVNDLEATYRETGGDLLALYSVLLNHPASWADTPEKVKRPFDFMATSLRALDIDNGLLGKTREQDLRNTLYIPMQIMGQPWDAPNGPDGWPEDSNHWITPQFMAARLQWALAAPRALRQALPDPRDFARAALGDRLPRDVAFVSEAAENRWEGIALVLTSPTFQRQ